MGGNDNNRIGPTSSRITFYEEKIKNNPYNRSK